MSSIRIWASWKNATKISRQRVLARALSQPLPCAHLVLDIDYKFQHTDEPPPHDDDEARRREEEELQRVLELSIQDKGGRKNWTEYSLASSSGAGGSSSKVATQSSTQASTAHKPAVSSISSTSTVASQQPTHSSGYTPSIETHAQAAAPPTAAEPPPQPSPVGSKSPAPSTEEGYVSRVRALYSFEPTDDNELAFEKGAIIKVHKREYKDWWRGACNGRIGIFPVNYVVRFRLASTPLPLLVLTFWWRSGTSSGTYTSRGGCRSTAGSWSVRSGGQRRSAVEHAAQSRPGQG